MNRRVMALLLAGVVLAPIGARAGSDCDWAQYGNGPAHTFSQDGCAELDVLSAPSLHLKWFVPQPDSVTASPAVVDGVVYVGGWDGVFHALDAESGATRWEFAIDDTNDVSFGRIVSSAAVVDGTVFFGGGATLYALDASSGTEIARACLDPRADSAVRCKGSSADIEIESSPAVVEVDGETWVVVGMSVHNAAGIGRTGVVALRFTGSSLDILWKFDPETLQTYTGPGALTTGAGEGHGCGGVWSSPAVDVEGDRVLFGTASCKHELAFNPAESIFGIALRTGAYVWHDSPLQDRGEGTRLDDDFGASANLLPGGLVGIGGKDGWYYARSRADGAGGWSTHAGQAGHATTDFAVGGMIGSAAVGAVDGAAAVFATTALSTPIDRPFDEGGPDPDGRLLSEDPGRMLSLHAIRASDGAILWRTPVSRQAYGSPTYANGVVLVPSTFDATIKAFHADTGALLWENPLVGASSSTPVIVGDSIYLGTGTRTTDAEYKQFGGNPFEPALGPHALSLASGIAAFELI